MINDFITFLTYMVSVFFRIFFNELSFFGVPIGYMFCASFLVVFIITSFIHNIGGRP